MIMKIKYLHYRVFNDIKIAKQYSGYSKNTLMVPELLLEQKVILHSQKMEREKFYTDSSNQQGKNELEIGMMLYKD